MDATQQTEDKDWAKVQQDALTQASEEAAETPAGEQKAVDPLADLPEPTRKLVESLDATVKEQAARLHEVGQKLATAHGMMGSMKQRLDASQAELQKIAPTMAAVEAQTKAAEQAKAADIAKRRDLLRSKVKEYPDILGEGVPEDELDSYLDAVLPADVKPVEAAKLEKREEAAEVDTGPTKEEILQLQVDLADRVPGWRGISKSSEFQAWLPKQPADVQAKAGSWDVNDAASVFEAFNKQKSDATEVARVEQDRANRLRRGETIQARGSSTGNVDTSEDGLWNQVKRDYAKAQSSA